MKIKGHIFRNMICAFLALLGSHPAANAALTFNLNNPVLGKLPTSTGPWLTAVFNNVLDSQNIPMAVSLTVTASLNVDSEYVGALAFNINPTIDPQSLSVVNDTPEYPQITSLNIAGQNAQNLTGAGTKGMGFDVLINWSTSNVSNGIRRFNSADFEQFTFTLAGLTEADFAYANSSGIYMAARVAGIPYQATTSSGTISGLPELSTPVPEPSTYLAGILLTLPVVVQHLRARKQVQQPVALQT